MSLVGAPKQPKRNSGEGADKEAGLANGKESTSAGMKRKRDGEVLMALYREQGDENKKKKRNRNRKIVNDLRFKELDALATGSRRKERKKKLLEAKKKKQENAQTEEDLDFPGREQIKFGDIVEAPPKLTIPKGFKTAKAGLGASHERLRLQAVEPIGNVKDGNQGLGLSFHHL